MGGKQADTNKTHTMTGLNKAENFMGFLVKFPLLPLLQATLERSYEEPITKEFMSLVSHCNKKAEKSMLILSEL